jgi:hypothetical protein
LAKITGRGSSTARRRRAGSNNSPSRTKAGARRGGSKATPRAAEQPAFVGRQSDEHSGVSKLASFLQSSFLRKIAAAGLASAAAALLYKKSDQTRGSNDQESADGEPATSAPALQPTRRTPVPRGQAPRRADSNTELASAGDVVPTGPVRTRKKRSDAGSKRPRKPDASSATDAAPRQLVPELQSTDTSVVALSADAGAPDQPQDSPSKQETAAHPS